MKRLLFIAYILFVSLSPIFGKSISFCTTISPRMWWVGMHNTELQLMLYGSGVSECEVSVDNSSALKLLRVERTPNPDYLFVYLDTREATEGEYYILLSKKSIKRTQTITYTLHKREDNSAQRTSFGQQDAVYLVMPDRFANGNPNNDNVNGYIQTVDTSDLHQRQGGDIQGIIDHLDYIADLGMTALWTTPLFDDDDAQYSYHHYATTDLYNVDPRFGTNEDFRRLVDSCHSYGLKYILDIVPNHLNVRYKWGSGIPDSAWLHQWTDFTRTNYQLCAQTDPYASHYDKNLLCNGWFDTNMADLNLANPLLADYIRQAYIYWIEYTGLDGIRVDTYPYNDRNDVAKLLGEIRCEYPNMNLVGECWVKSVPELSYYQSGTLNRDSFDSQLPSVMDFVLKDYLEWSFVEEEGWNRGLQRFYFHFAQDFVYSRPDLIMNMVDNHDMNRYGNAVDYNPDLYKMGITLIAIVRGFPQYYYGDEIMMEGRGGSYEDCRHRFSGGWKNDETNKFRHECRTSTENDIRSHLKKVLLFRRQSKAITQGKMLQFIPYDGIYCFFRYIGNEKVMVVVNNNNNDREVDITRFNEMNIIGHTAYDVINDTYLTIGKRHIFQSKSITIFDIQ